MGIHEMIFALNFLIQKKTTVVRLFKLCPRERTETKQSILLVELLSVSGEDFFLLLVQNVETVRLHMRL